MNTLFRYGKYDRTVWYVSSLIILGCTGVALWLIERSGGSEYIAAWFIVSTLTVMALCLLSAPVEIVVSDDKIELRSVVRSTYIPIESVVEIKTVKRRNVRWCLPLWGVFGFWGYYGRYIDLPTAKLYTMFATSRRRLVLITTSHRRFVVSCRQPNKLVETVEAQKSPKRR